MDSKDVEKTVVEALYKYGVRPSQAPRMEFSKKLILGASIFVGLFCIVSVLIWIFTGDWPREIAEFFIWPFIGIASYMIKSGYENKAKIENGKGEK
jgi:hypothetical protein